MNRSRPVASTAMTHRETLQGAAAVGVAGLFLPHSIAAPPLPRASAAASEFKISERENYAGVVVAISSLKRIASMNARSAGGVCLLRE